MQSKANSVEEFQDFSLVLGGPFFQMLRKLYLSGDGLQLLKRRMVVLSLVAWAPLGLLSALAQGDAGIPFLHDLEVHARFLVTLPLLVAAEMMVHQRLRPIVLRFLERKLIPDEALTDFKAAITWAFRWRNSLWVEFFLVLFVYGVGIGVIWRNYIALNTATWYSRGNGELTPAGMWYAYVSIPFFQFLLVRWYYRLLLWTGFLWRVSRLPLRLLATHPDGLGGLGFLTQSVHALAPLLVAHGALLSGSLANRIFFLGAKLTDFKSEILTLVALMLCIVLGPLLIFAPLLRRVRLAGMADYGGLAQRYVTEFDHKWLRGGASEGEELLGSGDIQSLADLGNSYQIVRGMGVVPFNRNSFTLVVGATILPIIPLALTMMPLEELLKKLLGVLL